MYNMVMMLDWQGALLFCVAERTRLRIMTATLVCFLFGLRYSAYVRYSIGDGRCLRMLNVFYYLGFAIFRWEMPYSCNLTPKIC